MGWAQVLSLLWAHRKKVVAALTAVLAVFAIGMLILITVIAGGSPPSADAALQDPTCQQQMKAQGIDPGKGLSFGVGPTANGRAVIAAGIEMKIPEKGIIVALAVAMQESGMRNLANPNVPESLSLPNEGVGQDHQSVGIMQQQPWWGTIAELMTPRIAAMKFYQALLKVGGWQSMAPTVAAQAVQRSAFPDAYANDVAAATIFYQKNVAAVVAATGGQVPDPVEGNPNPCEQVKPRSEQTTLVLANLPPGKADEKGLQRYTILTNRAVSAAFPQVKSIGGVRPDPLPWHPEGLALDVMIPMNPLSPEGIALGNGIRDFVLRNAKTLGVIHAIWRQRIWYPDGTSEAMENRGGLTANHFDHVHVATKGGGYP